MVHTSDVFDYICCYFVTARCMLHRQITQRCRYVGVATHGTCGIDVLDVVTGEGHVDRYCIHLMSVSLHMLTI